MLFENFLSRVTDSQFAIDACDYALCFGDFTDFSSKELSMAFEDIFLFHADMMEQSVSS